MFEFLIILGIIWLLSLIPDPNDIKLQKENHEKYIKELQDNEYKSLFTPKEWKKKEELAKYISYWDNPKSSRYKYVSGYRKELEEIIKTAEARKK